MEFVTEKSKEEILKDLKIYCFWDTNEDLEPYKEFLRTGDDTLLSIYKKKLLYYKILNGFSWHAIMKILPQGKLRELLEEDVLVRLFPKSLITNYRYVKGVLL